MVLNNQKYKNWIFLSSDGALGRLGQRGYKVIKGDGWGNMTFGRNAKNTLGTIFSYLKNNLCLD
jgi:hypothetical protein